MEALVCQCCSSKVDFLTSEGLRRDYVLHVEMLWTCFAIRLTFEDDKKNVICNVCAQKLKECCAFKYSVEQTQIKLSSGTLKNDFQRDVLIAEDSISLQMDVECDAIDSDDESDSTPLKYLQVKKGETTPEVSIEKESKVDDKSEKNKIRVGKMMNSTFTCIICKQTFDTEQYLHGHIVRQHINELPCTVCGQIFDRRAKLDRHRATHSELSQCKVCGKVMQKASLLRHTRQHNGDNMSYMCRVCDERFASLDRRFIHMRDAHSIDIYTHACPHCPKKYYLPSRLNKHVKTSHDMRRDHVCHVCGYACPASSKLRIHMSKHTGEKNFRCTVCDKRFPRRYTLNEHMKIHNGVRAHKCHVCQKAFVQKCALKGHMKVHTKGIA